MKSWVILNYAVNKLNSHHLQYNYLSMMLHLWSLSIFLLFFERYISQIIISIIIVNSYFFFFVETSWFYKHNDLLDVLRLEHRHFGRKFFTVFVVLKFNYRWAVAVAVEFNYNGTHQNWRICMTSPCMNFCEYFLMESINQSLCDV